jgi:hypothetical protein
MNKLDEYRGFRHVVRNVYTYHLSPEKIEPLVDTVQEVITNSEKELSALAEFLQTEIRLQLSVCLQEFC